MRKGKKIQNKKLKFKSRKNISGQSVVEYVLLLFIGVVLSLGILTSFNQMMRKGILKFNVNLEANLRTGEITNPTNPAVWEN